MVKKKILMMFIAWFLMHTPLHDTKNINSKIKNLKKNYLEDYTDKYERLLEEQRKRLSKEIELLKKDKIYRIINDSYKNINPPHYISKEFIRTIIKAESEDNPHAISPVGARGLGQLMESAWYEVEKENYWKNVFNPEKNIQTSIKYLAWIDKECKRLNPNWDNLTNKNKIELIAAAYNGGIGRLKQARWKISNMPEETRKYIPKLEQLTQNFMLSTQIYQFAF